MSRDKAADKIAELIMSINDKAAQMRRGYPPDEILDKITDLAWEIKKDTDALRVAVLALQIYNTQK